MNPFARLLPLLPLLAAPLVAQNIGDTVTPDVLGKLDWIKGEAPTAWEPGKLYILECWATWCGPCIDAIPHMDALYDKYHERGLNVLGMDVFEEGRDKVAVFVAKEGDGMSYPVAYTRQGGPFETNWLIPAGVKSIPYAFLVKDGKVILKIHPASITEDLVEAILAGGDREAQALKPLVEKQQYESVISRAQADFKDASKKGDLSAMNSSVAILEKIDPESRMLDPMRLKLLVRQSKWEEAETIVNRLPDTPERTITLTEVGTSEINKDGVPASFFKALAEHFGGVPVDGSGLLALTLQSRLYWKADEKNEALATIKKAVELSDTAEVGKIGAILRTPLRKFEAMLESGRLATNEEFDGWVKESVAATPKH